MDYSKYYFDKLVESFVSTQDKLHYAARVGM